jgi:large subunit ribosomal protein L28
MARVCSFSGKRPNVAHKVSHSNIKTKRRQFPNLQRKRLWWDERQAFVRVRLSTEALRTIGKKGLQAYARGVGLDLSQYVE